MLGLVGIEECVYSKSVNTCVTDLNTAIMAGTMPRQRHHFCSEQEYATLVLQLSSCPAARRV